MVELCTGPLACINTLHPLPAVRVRSVWTQGGRSLAISNGDAEIECEGGCAWMCMECAS